jgi:hypothetical protein
MEEIVLVIISMYRFFLENSATMGKILSSVDGLTCDIPKFKAR